MPVTGCDSLLVLSLIVQPFIIASENQIICGGDSILFGSEYVQFTGVYYDTVSVLGSCDSVLNLQMNVSYVIHIYDNINARLLRCLRFQFIML